jgi:hypothetical protein
MADQPKKPRTAAQAAQNEKQRQAAAALKEAGLKAFVPNVTYYIQQEKAGKEKATIIEEIRGRQTERAAAPKAPKKATAAANAGPKATGNGNGTRNNKPKGTANNGTAKKLRSAAQLAADKKMANLKAAFNTHKIKYGAPAMKHFKEQKALGRVNSEIYEEMKALFPKFTVNESGAEKPVVAKRAVTAKKAANVVGVANAGVAKGQYVCEKCRLVANNTRKNNRGNNKPKNNMSGNFFPVNMTNF